MIKKALNSKPINYAFAYLCTIAVYTLIYSSTHCHLGIKSGFVNSFYLSIVTITTLGFGDITPSTDIGKIIVSTQALLGILLFGLFLNAISHARNDEIQDSYRAAEKNRKEEFRKSLEIHACLIIDAIKSGNPFIWDKHAKYSASINDLEDFINSTLQSLKKNRHEIHPSQIRALLETSDQNYDTLLSLMPVAAEISPSHVIEWSSLISNVRNLKQQYSESLMKINTKGIISWPDTGDISTQVQELIQTTLFISDQSKVEN